MLEVVRGQDMLMQRQAQQSDIQTLRLEAYHRTIEFSVYCPRRRQLPTACQPPSIWACSQPWKHYLS